MEPVELGRDRRSLRPGEQKDLPVKILEVNDLAAEKRSGITSQATLPAKDVVDSRDDQHRSTGKEAQIPGLDLVGPAGVRGAFDDGQWHGTTLWSEAAPAF
jgi:hypothetical protein